MARMRGRPTGGDEYLHRLLSPPLLPTVPERLRTRLVFPARFFAPTAKASQNRRSDALDRTHACWRRSLSCATAKRPHYLWSRLCPLRGPRVAQCCRASQVRVLAPCWPCLTPIRTPSLDSWSGVAASRWSFGTPADGTERGTRSQRPLVALRLRWCSIRARSRL
jgi:hypothetical protein